MKDNVCFFRNKDGSCGAIAGVYCPGINDKCSFYKTEKQYITDRNLAILKNRAKGNCVNCKYVPVACELIPVVKDENI